MTPERFHDAALRLAGAEFSVKWRGERVYSVNGRMFAIGGRLGQLEPCYRFKASPESFELLVASGAARPAPYLARAMWVELTRHDALSDEELTSYLQRSHAMVARAPRSRGR